MDTKLFEVIFAKLDARPPLVSDLRTWLVARHWDSCYTDLVLVLRTLGFVLRGRGAGVAVWHSDFNSVVDGRGKVRSVRP